jgi:hypothetical protein
MLIPVVEYVCLSWKTSLGRSSEGERFLTLYWDQSADVGDLSSSLEDAKFSNDELNSLVLSPTNAPLTKS